MSKSGGRTYKIPGDEHYKNWRPQAQEEILWIEMAVRAIQNEALERYMFNPGNVDLIVRKLGDTLKATREIESNSSCPVGFSHKNCACVADIKQG
jgi:hypothetical protein